MIGKWHISEEHKRFCELASGLGKICCFQEREGGMQSPLVPRDWAGSRFGVGCGAVIPLVLPATSRLAVLVLGGSCSAEGLPKLFRVSPDIYYIFCLGFFIFFFAVKKTPDAVREGWGGRCSGASSPCATCALQPLSPVVLATLKPAGAPVPSSPSLGSASHFQGFVPAGRSAEAGGAFPWPLCPGDRIHLLLPGTFCCSDQWCEFHDLCTCMNFAVHPSGSSAFTFTVYFLVCLIRWLCWLYLNSLYFYAGF